MCGSNSWPQDQESHVLQTASQAILVGSFKYGLFRDFLQMVTIQAAVGLAESMATQWDGCSPPQVSEDPFQGGQKGLSQSLQRQ